MDMIYSLIRVNIPIVCDVLAIVLYERWKNRGGRTMELKPCPFCGSDRVEYVPTPEQHYEDHEEGFIWCHGCDFSSDVFLDPEIAAEKWNRRANNV